MFGGTVEVPITYGMWISTMFSGSKGIFTSAAGDLVDMLQPIMTAGVPIMLGIMAFTVAKGIFKTATKK